MSQLVSNRHPIVAQVVPAAKYLKVEAIWNEFLDVFVHLCGLLRLSSSFTENYVASNVCLEARRMKITLEANNAAFLSMLQIVPMSFGYFAVHCLLDPCHFIDYFVPPLFYEFTRKSVFCVNGPMLSTWLPDTDKTICLKPLYGNCFNGFVHQAIVLDGYSSRGLRCR